MCGEARKVSLDRGFDQMRNNIFRGKEEKGVIKGRKKLADGYFKVIKP
jgi:hypothetical protein